MTANEHPISDAELDAVLGAAAAHLNDTLARTVDIPAGLASMATEPASRPDNTPHKAESIDGGAPRDKTAALHSVSAQIFTTLHVLETFPSGRGKAGKTTAREIAALGPALKQLDHQLAQRVVSRQEAQRVLQQVDVRLGTSIERLAATRERTGTFRFIVPWLAVASLISMFFVSAKAEHQHGSTFEALVASLVLVGVMSAAMLIHHRCTTRKRVAIENQMAVIAQLQAFVKQLSVAVERLFDDAEDWSATPAGCR
ncbi:hypothetical protein ACIRSS_23835 [Amycolatopsis sp. NPDC101161]|uniref:hypothetical protein n=1 Tax=Amycolatopsis sp. NPDC101161 TaxID=3363940 RepID=UPI00381D948D